MPPRRGRPPGTKDSRPRVYTKPRTGGPKPGPNSPPPCEGCGRRSRGHHKEGCPKRGKVGGNRRGKKKPLILVDA